MSFNVLRLQERRKRYEAEEREEEAKRTSPLINAFNQSLIALRKKQDEVAREFWSRPLEKITKESTLSEPTAVDELLECPTTERRDQKAERQTYDSFISTLTATSGFTLSVAGSKRLLAYAITQATIRGVDLSKREAWIACFDRLYSLGCFDETSEIGFDASLRTVAPTPEPEPAPAPEPTMADLDSIPSTRDGLALQRKIVIDHVFGTEAKAVFTEWLDSLEKNFGFRPVNAHQKMAVDFFREHNYSFLDRRAYDRARLALIKRGVFPASAMTPDEKLVQEIEASGHLDYAAKNELRRKQLLIHQQST